MVSSRKQANVDATVAELVANGLVAIGVPCHVGKADDRAKLVAATVYVYDGVGVGVVVLSHPHRHLLGMTRTLLLHSHLHLAFPSPKFRSEPAAVSCVHLLPASYILTLTSTALHCTALHCTALHCTAH